MRRYAFLVLILALFVSGCLSRNPGPAVDSQHGLVTVAMEDADPIPWSSPYDPPILTATVQPAPLVDGYEECREFLEKPFNRICAADWSRSVVTPGEEELISLVLMTGPEVTRFRVVFAGHRPGEMPDGFAISREYVAPPFWSGELTFDVPIAPPFTRVLFAQVQWRSESDWVPVTQFIAFAPCPEDFPWPEDGSDYEECQSVVR